MKSIYKIFEANTFQKELEEILSPANAKQIKNKIFNYIYPQLKTEPHFGLNIKKLKNYKPESWRYRLGDFRLFYSIDEDKKVVILTAMRWRKDAY